MFNEYLLSTYDKNDDLLIYDTLRYNTVRIRKEDFHKFNNFRSQILLNGEYNGPIQNLDIFLSNNIIRHINDDINCELQKKYNEVILSNKVLSLIILPTEQCNFRCVYCYENFHLGKMENLTVEKIVSLLERLLPQYDQLNISWFGGEPLIALDIIQVISQKVEKLCKKYKKPYFSQITTNGYLLNLSVMKELLRMHVMLFQITIDGDRNTHNRQRFLANGYGTYDVIIKNLLEIKNNIKTQTIRIIIRVNVSRDTNVNEIYSLAEMFIDDPRFVFNVQEIFKTNKNENKIEINHSYYLETYKACSELYSDKLTADDTICYAAKSNTLMIRSNGSLGKCTVNFDDLKNSFGNIKNIDIDKFSLKSIDYCNSIIDIKRCIKCCIYPLCFGKQCPAHQQQMCRTTIEKYRILLQTFSSRANTIQMF